MKIIDMFDTQQYKKKLDALSSSVLSAYLDSAIFMSIVKLAKDKQRINVFLGRNNIELYIPKRSISGKQK